MRGAREQEFINQPENNAVGAKHSRFARRGLPYRPVSFRGDGDPTQQEEMMMTAKLADEVKLRTNDMKWIEFAPGIEYKILRTSPETGAWTVLFRCAKGSGFPPHLHYGAGEYFLFKGSMEYRMGGAKAGDYGYEPLGVYHESTQFTEDSELLFTNYGPIAFVNEDMSVKFLLDWKFFADQQVGNQVGERKAA